MVSVRGQTVTEDPSFAKNTEEEVGKRKMRREKRWTREEKLVSGEGE